MGCDDEEDSDDDERDEGSTWEECDEFDSGESPPVV